MRDGDPFEAAYGRLAFQPFCVPVPAGPVGLSTNPAWRGEEPGGATTPRSRLLPRIALMAPRRRGRSRLA